VPLEGASFPPSAPSAARTILYTLQAYTGNCGNCGNSPLQPSLHTTFSPHAVDFRFRLHALSAPTGLEVAHPRLTYARSPRLPALSPSQERPLPAALRHTPLRGPCVAPLRVPYSLLLSHVPLPSTPAMHDLNASPRVCRLDTRNHFSPFSTETMVYAGFMLQRSARFPHLWTFLLISGGLALQTAGLFPW
jgi:hypothetical protein